MEKETAEWYVIVNPQAGSGKTMTSWKPAERILISHNIPFKTVLTESKDHAENLAYKAAEDGYRRILAVGGDGTLHECFNGICKWCDDNGADTADFHIGVIPIGSGNDWLRSIGLPADPISVANLVNDNSFGQMDVVKVIDGEGKPHYMANVGGMGFDSHVCMRVNQMKEQGKRSRLLYIKALIHTIFHLGAINLKVIADDEMIFDGPCFSVALGNGRYSGNGLRQVPLADNNDGILDIMVVPKVKLGTILRVAPRLLNGTLDKATEVVMRQFRKLEIIPLDPKSHDYFELDGEIRGNLPLSIDYTPRKINILATGK